MPPMWYGGAPEPAAWFFFLVSFRLPSKPTRKKGTFCFFFLFSFASKPTRTCPLFCFSFFLFLSTFPPNQPEKKGYLQEADRDMALEQKECQAGDGSFSQSHGFELDAIAFVTEQTREELKRIAVYASLTWDPWEGVHLPRPMEPVASSASSCQQTLGDQQLLSLQPFFMDGFQGLAVACLSLGPTKEFYVRPGFKSRPEKSFAQHRRLLCL